MVIATKIDIMIVNISSTPKRVTKNIPIENLNRKDIQNIIELKNTNKNNKNPNKPRNL